LQEKVSKTVWRRRGRRRNGTYVDALLVASIFLFQGAMDHGAALTLEFELFAFETATIS